MNDLMMQYGLIIAFVGTIGMFGAMMEYEFNVWSYKWGPRIAGTTLLIGITLLAIGSIT